jgi:hypothetical protein
MPGSNVNDAETAMAQADASIDENALVVGTSVPQNVTHALEHLRVDASI